MEQVLVCFRTKRQTMRLAAANDQDLPFDDEATQPLKLEPGEASLLFGQAAEREADRQWWLGGPMSGVER